MLFIPNPRLYLLAFVVFSIPLCSSKGFFLALNRVYPTHKKPDTSLHPALCLLKISFFCSCSYYNVGDWTLSCPSLGNGSWNSLSISFWDSNSRSPMNSMKSLSVLRHNPPLPVKVLEPLRGHVLLIVHRKDCLKTSPSAAVRSYALPLHPCRPGASLNELGAVSAGAITALL